MATGGCRPGNDIWKQVISVGRCTDQGLAWLLGISVLPLEIWTKLAVVLHGLPWNQLSHALTGSNNQPCPVVRCFQR
jgi:hypothetical protein